MNFEQLELVNNFGDFNILQQSIQISFFDTDENEDLFQTDYVLLWNNHTKEIFVDDFSNNRIYKMNDCLFLFQMFQKLGLTENTFYKYFGIENDLQDLPFYTPIQKLDGNCNIFKTEQVFILHESPRQRG